LLKLVARNPLPLNESETETFIFEDLSSSVMSQFKKYHPSGNLKFDYLGVFQSLKLRNLTENVLPISL